MCIICLLRSYKPYTSQFFLSAPSLAVKHHLLRSICSTHQLHQSAVHGEVDMGIIARHVLHPMWPRPIGTKGRNHRRQLQKCSGGLPAQLRLRRTDAPTC